MFIILIFEDVFRINKYIRKMYVCLHHILFQTSPRKPHEKYDLTLSLPRFCSNRNKIKWSLFSTNTCVPVECTYQELSLELNGHIWVSFTTTRSIQNLHTVFHKSFDLNGHTFRFRLKVLGFISRQCALGRGRAKNGLMVFSETKRNETKRNETKQSETKTWNEIKH